MVFAIKLLRPSANGGPITYAANLCRSNLVTVVAEPAQYFVSIFWVCRYISSK